MDLINHDTNENVKKYHDGKRTKMNELLTVLK